MRLLRAKIWKILSVDKKDQSRGSVWVMQADFSKIAQSKHIFLNTSTACLLRKINAQ